MSFFIQRRSEFGAENEPADHYRTFWEFHGHHIRVVLLLLQDGDIHGVQGFESPIRLLLSKFLQELLRCVVLRGVNEHVLGKKFVCVENLGVVVVVSGFFGIVQDKCLDGNEKMISSSMTRTEVSLRSPIFLQLFENAVDVRIKSVTNSVIEHHGLLSDQPIQLDGILVPANAQQIV